MIGSSARFTHAISMASRAAASDAAVLIKGETGTGKKVLAKAIHFQKSTQEDRPMVAVNCGAIPRESLESESVPAMVKRSFAGP